MYDNDVFKYPYHKNNYSFEIEVSIPKATETERIIVLVYTHEVISTESERKPLKDN